MTQPQWRLTVAAGGASAAIKLRDTRPTVSTGRRQARADAGSPGRRGGGDLRCRRSAAQASAGESEPPPGRGYYAMAA